MTAPRRKIAVLATSRATYGYERKVIRLIHEHPDLELQLIVTGMHLVPAYGYSVREIEADGFPIAARVDMMLAADTPGSWVKSLGVELQGLAQVFEMLKPDIVLVNGDRAETFAAVVAAAYMSIPVAHVQAGDVSGHIDGAARHAITKLANIHLASCDDSAQRVLKMGEEPWRVHDVGAPQLDEILHAPRIARDELSRRLEIDFDKGIALVIQHAVLAEVDEAEHQMRETMEAIVAEQLPSIVIYPNVDAGGQKIIAVIRQYEHLPYIRTFQNIERPVFISLLPHVSMLIGNSSCGILEAPSFGLPTLNIGNRQRGRMQASNVLDVPHDRTQIRAAIQRARTDQTFIDRARRAVNPYGDGHSSERIVKLLAETPLDKRLIDKLITY